MIINKETGQDFGGLIKYLLNDKKNGEENRATIIGGNVFGDSSRELASQFAYVYKKKPETPKLRKHTDKKTGEVSYREVSFKPVRHFSLRVAEEDRDLTQKECQQIATDFLGKMGFKDCAHLIVMHKNEGKEGTHFHIATSQYDLLGKRVNEHRDIEKIKDLARGYENQFNLRVLDNKALYSLSGEQFATNSPRYQQHRKRRNKTAYYKKFEGDKQSKRQPHLNFAEYKFFQLYQQENSQVKYCAHYDPNLIYTRLKNNDSITDKGHSLTANSQQEKIDKDTVKAMVQMVHAKGMKRVSASGNDDFVLKSWILLEEVGIEVSVKPEQEELYNKFNKLKEHRLKAQQPKPEPRPIQQSKESQEEKEEMAKRVRQKKEQESQPANNKPEPPSPEPRQRKRRRRGPR